MPPNYTNLSRDQLISLLEDRDSSFGLVWDASKADRQLDEATLPILSWQAAGSIGAAPHRNMLIEGDNFDALRLLRATHKGRVHCVYIDVPYNMGKDDFIYNDDYLDKKATFRHSKWLAFMHPRLALSKDLLTDDGVIFVSVDDHEYHHLKMLMDQVFAGQYLGTFVKRVAGGKNQAEFIKNTHEYLLCYGSTKGLRLNESFNEKDSTRSLRKDGDTDRREDRPNLYYPLYADASSGAVSLTPFVGASEVYPKRPDGTDGRWRWKKDTAQDDIHRLVPKIARDGSVGIYVLSEAGAEKASPWDSLIDDSASIDRAWHSIINDHAKGGGAHLMKVLGEKAFTYPKNPDYIHWICSLVRRTDAVFLDFFAGSGTTGEAVLRLNSEDGGTRSFICASSTEATKDKPEKNICRDVTRLRLNKVINGYSYKSGNALKTEEPLGGNLAYFRVSAMPHSHLALDLQDEQVWTALQLRALGSFSPFDAATALQVATTETGVVCYARNAGSPNALAELKELCTNEPEVHVFSWKQSDKLAQLVESHENVTYDQIPADLLAMFGASQC